MRQFFFCFVFFLGLFWVIDVLALESQNSADAWEQLRRIGQKFSGAINDQVGQIWRWVGPRRLIKRLRRTVAGGLRCAGQSRRVTKKKPPRQEGGLVPVQPHVQPVSTLTSDKRSPDISAHIGSNAADHENVVSSKAARASSVRAARMRTARNSCRWVSPPRYRRGLLVDIDAVARLSFDL